MLIRYSSMQRVNSQTDSIQWARHALLVNETASGALASELTARSPSIALEASTATMELAAELARFRDQEAPVPAAASDGAGADPESAFAETRSALQRFLAVADSVMRDSRPELSAKSKLELFHALEVTGRDSRQKIAALLSVLLAERERTLDSALHWGTFIDIAIVMMLLAVAVLLFEPTLKKLELRRLALDRVMAANARLALIAERTDNAVVVADARGRIEWVNRAFIRISGYELEEVKGRTPGSVLQRADADQAAVERTRAAVREGKPFSESLLNYSKSGEPYWMRVDCQPLHDESGVLTGFMAVQSDITEERQRRAALERLNLRFAMSTEAAGVGVWELDWDSKQMWWSETLFKIVGVPPQAVASGWYRWVSLVHPSDRDAVQAAIERAIARCEPLHLQHRIIAPAGAERTLEITAAVARSELTRSAVLIGVAVDISERIALLESERRLQLRIREASRAAGMAEVATGVLHNVGNILNSLGIAVATAQSRARRLKIDQVEEVLALLLARRDDLAHFLAQEQTGREIAEYIPMLLQSIRSEVVGVSAEIDGLTGLVDHLRRIVKAQQSYSRLSTLPEALDVREVLDASCMLLAPSFEAEGGSVQTIHQYAPVPLVETNRTRLLDICCNLIKNAHEAMADSPGPKTLTLRVESVDDGVSISVADTGAGISDENLCRLWEFGFTTKGGGHGFGLHSVASGIHELGGHISVHSDGPGKGCLLYTSPSPRD